MKILDKIGLAVFSTIVLLLSIVVCLLLFGWLDVDFVFEMVKRLINNEMASNIMLGLNIIFILLAIKCIFFEGSDKDEADYKNGILLENADGKLLITKDTLENLVNNIVKGFEGADSVTSRVELDKENNVRVYINLNVKENANIKELSTNLQTKIKSTIKKTSDLEVKEVNIKVKDVQPNKNIIETNENNV